MDDRCCCLEGQVEGDEFLRGRENTKAANALHLRILWLSMR